MVNFVAQPSLECTETFANEAERRKAQREVAAFHRFQQLGRELLAINEKICRPRPLEQEDRLPQGKKRPKRSTRKSLKK